MQAVGINCINGIFKGFKVKVAIITAIFKNDLLGKYDDLKDPVTLNQKADFICFTNQNLRSNIWNIIKPSEHLEYIGNVEDLQERGILTARFYKINHHRIKYLQNYNYTIWLDGSYQVLNKKFVSDSLKFMEKGDLALLLHHKRNTVKEEVDKINRLDKTGEGRFKNQGNISSAQYSHYIKQGFLDKNNLYATGYMVRNNQNEKIKEFMDKWWKEVCKRSVRDQLSFPYICWLLNFNPIVIGQHKQNRKIVGKIFPHNL